MQLAQVKCIRIKLKRFFAIILLSIHLFFMGGYSFVFQYFIDRADVQIVKEIYNNKIDDSKLLELKIPVHMPTITDWDDFAAITGQIQLKDACYNYVRLKMTRDTMYLICLLNTTKMRLIKANIIAAKQVSDVPTSKKSDPGAKKINLLSEYKLPDPGHQQPIFGTLRKPDSKPVSTEIDQPFINSPGKPPDPIS